MQTLQKREMILLYAIVDYMANEARRVGRNRRMPNPFRAATFVNLTSGMIFEQGTGFGLYHDYVDELGGEAEYISHPQQFSRLVGVLRKAGLLEENRYVATPQGVKLVRDYLLDGNFPVELQVDDGEVVHEEYAL